MIKDHGWRSNVLLSGTWMFVDENTFIFLKRIGVKVYNNPTSISDIVHFLPIYVNRGQERPKTTRTKLLFWRRCVFFFSTGHVPRFELGRDYCCELRLFGRPTFWGNVFFSRPRVFADLSARDNGKTNGWNVWYYNFVTSAEGRDNNGHVARPSRNITRSLRSD